MGLKEIKIVGFKSFAEFIRIAFCEGINAIVGPNGCGKSNIVDAFLWALGQQSAKTLRASSMQDVIFAGSLKRKAHNMAEVTVVLSNENGLLPIEYQEVAITRRLYSNGDSEYLINKQAVRLKDIQELLAHTGVGKEAFAVIGQGKVAEIISQSPQDRRSLFEVVAGISHFLIKRKESERKLELSKANVSRAKDILAEVETQKKTLEKQANDAKRFQEIRTKLACYERLLAEAKFSELKSACKTVSIRAKNSEGQLKEAQEKETLLKSEQQEKKERFKVSQKAYLELSDACHILERSLEAIKKDIDFCEEKKGTLSSQEKDSTSQLSSFELRLKSIDEQKNLLEAELAKKEKELSELKDKKDRAFTDWQKSFQSLETHETNLKNFYQKRFSLQSSMQAKESDLKKTQLAEEVAKEKVAERRQQKEKFEALKNAHEAEADQKRKELKNALSLVDTHKAALEKVSLLHKEVVQEVEGSKGELGKIKEQLYEKEARFKALSSLASQMEGYTSSAKTLLQEAKKPGSELFGKVMPLADFVNLEHELLGRLYDASLLVFTNEDLELALKRAQDVSFVCLERMCIKDPHELKNHFLTKITKESWLDGKYYVDGFGVIHAQKAKGESIFSRSKELKSLEKEISSLKAAFTDVEAKLKASEEKRQKLLAEVQKEDQEMRRADMQVVQINFQLGTQDKRLQEILRDVEKQESEMSSLHELSTKLKEQLKTKDDELKAAKELLVTLEAEFTACENAAKELRIETSKLNETKQKSFYLYDTLVKTVEKDRHTLELLMVQKKEVSSRFEQELKLQKTIREERASLDGKKQDTAKLLEQKAKELEAKKLELSEKKEAQDALEAKIKQEEKQIEELQANKEAYIKSTSSEQRELEHLQEQLIIYDTALREPPPEGLSQYAGVIPSEEEILRLKNQHERMRNVNLLAVEEHEAACERFSLLSNQLADLESAESELIKIITELEKESHKSFSKTFEEVRSAFQKHFQTLFQGGEADLVLVDNGSGVDIFAKPPGKQMRSMQLLSGGEKTLTALALLFACFDVRPSPFCILDEVDAPLDETNVERFGKLLKHFCDRTQFLVITHNKKTMQIADTLIGVSMAEKGVSQIISIDFKRRESPQDAILIS